MVSIPAGARDIYVFENEGTGFEVHSLYCYVCAGFLFGSHNRQDTKLLHTPFSPEVENECISTTTTPYAFVLCADTKLKSNFNIYISPGVLGSVCLGFFLPKLTSYRMYLFQNGHNTWLKRYFKLKMSCTLFLGTYAILFIRLRTQDITWQGSMWVV